MFNLEEDAPARRLAYLSALLLIVVPFLQAITQLWPLQLGNIQWRFQAAGALSSVLLLPYLGFVLMALVARAIDQRGVSRTVGILSAILALFLAASLILFILDALQLKTIVQSQAMSAFKVASVRVALITTLFTVLFAMLALTALKPPRSLLAASRPGRKGAPADVGLVIGQEFARAE